MYRNTGEDFSGSESSQRSEKGTKTMMTITALFLFVLVFGKLMISAIKLGWGVLKVVVFAVLLPAIVLFMIFSGLVWLAISVMLVAGLVGMAVTA